MTTAIVLGANGQDGSYLVEALLNSGADVFGIARQSSSKWVDASRFNYISCDLREASAFERILAEIAPDEIYFVAAVHGAAGFGYESVWQDALVVNVGAVHSCLEYCRLINPRARLFYASSLKVFGAVPPVNIDEETLRRSDCLYSITKNAATDLIAYYRTTHDVFASVGYLFNHDSPRRADNYFLPRLTAQLAHALTGAKGRPPSPLATLDFACDWGSSAEFMKLAINVLRLDAPADFVFASGLTWRATDLVETLSAAGGLKTSEWLRLSEPSARQQPQFYQANTAKLRAAIGVAPEIDAVGVVAWILKERYALDLAVRYT